MSGSSVAERAPLVTKRAETIDVERADASDEARGERRRGTRAAVVATATVASIGALAFAGVDLRGGAVGAVGSSMGFVGMNGRDDKADDLRRARLASLGGNTTEVTFHSDDNSKHRRCVLRQSASASEDAEKYFVVKGLHSEAGLGMQKKLSDWTRKRKVSPDVFAVTPSTFKLVRLFGDAESNVEEPYLLPKNGWKKAIEAKNNTAMLYNFVHVPKAGGTNFQLVMTNLANKLNRQKGDPVRRNLMPPGYFVPGISPAPLLDTTIRGVMVTAHAFLEKDNGAFATDHLKQAYEKGQRMISKGPYSMGICSTTEAPCAYITVIRDPYERFMSHYKYSCLEGSEGQAMWLPEWKQKKECPLTPLEWMAYTLNDDWTQLIAPGVFPHGSKCHQKAFENNIMSGCVRYLLMAKIEDGLKKLKTKLPDFEGLDIAAERNGFKNGSDGKMTPRLKQRLNAYLKDTDMMQKVKDAIAYQTEMYKFAVDNYEKSWDRELQTC